MLVPAMVPPRTAGRRARSSGTCRPTLTAEPIRNCSGRQTGRKHPPEILADAPARRNFRPDLASGAPRNYMGARQNVWYETTLVSYPCFIPLFHTFVSYPCFIPLFHTLVSYPLCRSMQLPRFQTARIQQRMVVCFIPCFICVSYLVAGLQGSWRGAPRRGT